MNHLSHHQLIRLWSELEQAYYGDNKYGGDTAEIYAYEVMEYSPVLCLAQGAFDNQKADAYECAAQTLCEVLAWFAQARECRVRIDGRSLTAWKRDHPPFDHRVHIKVVR